MDTVRQIMKSHGYGPVHTGGGFWTWMRPTEDESNLWVCTYDSQLEGDPGEPEWYVGRRNDVGGCYQCDDLLTLAEALALAPRIKSPVGQGDLQVTLPRVELEALA